MEMEISVIICMINSIESESGLIISLKVLVPYYYNMYICLDLEGFDIIDVSTLVYIRTLKSTIAT